MARVGDVNGDGYDDLTVGFVLYYGRGINSSSISVFLGSATGLKAVPAWGPSGAGSSFYGVGDINGDGCTDLAVADPNNDAGKVAIFHDSAATVPRLFLPAAHKP
jgi:hypothetical protein